MEATAIQCPNCGSPVDPAEAVKGKLVCKSCGSVLELTMGSSGFPMAHLLAMEEDTDYIAKTQAAERLKEQIMALGLERENLKEKMAIPEESQVGCGLVSTIAAVIVGIMVDSGMKNDFPSIFWFVLPLIVVVIFTTEQKRQSKQYNAQVQEAEKLYGQRLAEIEQLLAEKIDQLAKLEGNLDSAIKSI